MGNFSERRENTIMKTINFMGVEYPSIVMGGRPRFVTTMNVSAWCATYELEVLTVNCRKCGRPISANMPFWVGTVRGLVAPVCACGHNQGTHTFIDTDFGTESLNALGGIHTSPTKNFGRLLHAVADVDA